MVLGRPLRNARGEWRERTFLQVRVRHREAEAVGEAAPLPGFTEDSLDAARRTLQGMSWEGLSERLDDPQALLAEVGRRAPGSASARFAVEAALLQLCARRQGRSVAAIAAELLGTRPTPIDIAAWVDGEDVEAVVEAARRAVAGGHRTLKLKIGLDADRELRVAASLRDALGDGIRLRFDANGRLTAAEGLSLLRALARIGAELVEEPGPSAIWPQAAALVPVAADESLAALTEEEVEPLLASGQLAALVVKPMVLGLAGSLGWARAATRHGVPVVVSHLLGGPREMDIAEALACAVGAPLAHGLGHHAVLAASGERPRPARRGVPEAPCP